MQVMLDACTDLSQAACHQSALHLPVSLVCHSVSQSVSQPASQSGMSDLLVPAKLWPNQITLSFTINEQSRARMTQIEHNQHQSVTAPPASGLHYHACLKHLHNVEMRSYCPQTFLSLDLQCRDDVSEVK